MPDSREKAMPFRRNGVRIYRICWFEPGAVVPRVDLLEASSDEQAIALASVDLFTEREVWDMHRLVARLPMGKAARSVDSTETV